MSHTVAPTVSTVPIHDGRQRSGSHFQFRPSGIATVKLLPRYTEERDLDAFTLMTVGYSVGVWNGFNDHPRVGTNALFVIFLGSAPSRELLTARNLI